MRWERFLTDEKGEPSSTRLGLFLTIVLISAAMIICAVNKDPQSGVIAVALAGLAGGAFVGGKMSQDSVTKTQMKASDPPPQPPEVT
jgi:hypothetical protein